MWNGTKIKINITWIRHGMTKANEEHRYLGRTDEDLSPEGICALRKQSLTETAGSGQMRLIVSSPMLRCVHTAEILFGKKPDLLIYEWREMDFGRFERKNYQELKDEAEYMKWLESNGTLPFPEGESREVFIKRSMKGLAQLFMLLQDDHREQDEYDIIAVVHGGTIMAVLSELTRQPYFDFQVKNGSGFFTQLETEKDQIYVTKIEESLP